MINILNSGKIKKSVQFKACGFTLAEVLITLGIIGVVAAMTLPTLIAKYNERVYVEKLKQTYSIFSQAYLRAVADNGPIEYWDLGETMATMEGAVNLYNYLKPYLLKSKECVDESGCFAENYITLDGKQYGFQPKNHTQYSRGILANGTSFALAADKTGCSEAKPYPNYCGVLYVDLNGLKTPNQAGVDYFGFYFTVKGLYPIGIPGFANAPGNGNRYVCYHNKTTAGNGVGCTAWVIQKGNMDYLRRDITKEWE